MRYKIKNISNHLCKIPTFIAGHFLFSLFAVVLFVIFLANLFFYNYYILNREATLKTEEGKIIVNDNGYNNLLKIWEEQDKIFQESDSKIYIDFLNPR